MLISSAEKFKGKKLNKTNFMKSKKTNPDEIKAGDLVAYKFILGTIHVKVLEIDPKPWLTGWLVLDTKTRHELVESKSYILKKGELITFNENIKVQSDSVKKLKAA
jgi:hypothetical protein